MSNPMDNAPESGTEFVERWQANADHLEQFGMYDPADEHASCGVGMIATTMLALFMPPLQAGAVLLPTQV